MAKEFQYCQWLNIAVRGIFTEIEKCCSNKQEVTEGILASLHTLFPLQSVTALDLIDHRSVSLMTSSSGNILSKKKPCTSSNNFKISGRKIYSCLGSLGTPYLISYTGFTCTCPSYRHNLDAENLWCPHLLAVQLSIAMGIVQQKQVTEDVMKTMLSELVMFDD
ncbi:zinc finger SWIM domain-containing protein 7-like [Daphnia carinata]|uniref:zinc finger SWIM domain-containing protein 7-like n=1 Tax=Daphnia carinata TaxID=120202 RepID=UPI002868FC44|nr:zinc finger SWIM domain-containing protein 7-like [Daphnia carinata]